MLEQPLEDQSAADAKDMDNEKAGKAQAVESKATTVSDLAVTSKDSASSKGATCLTVASDHAETVAARRRSWRRSLKPRKSAVR